MELMIARIWEGKTKKEHGELYQELIESRDIPGYQKVKGFVRFSFFKKSDDEFTHFKLVTIWESLEAVKEFTGKDYQKAIGFEEDKTYLLDYPGRVDHYEVFALKE